MGIMYSRREANEQMIFWGKQMVRDGLAWGNGGNISVRVGSDRFLVTASGSSLGELSTNDLVEVTLSGEVTAPSRRPSKEVQMHAAIYSKRSDINAVVHSHPFYGLVMACSGEVTPQNWFVENAYYQERIAHVQYHHPGSECLAKAVSQKAHEANLLILENHGILAYDVNIREAYLGIQTFEIMSKMYVMCRSANITIKGLPKETVREFLEESGYKPRREWPEL